MYRRNEQKPTIKDIADAADVSIATVSRVLNNKGRYSKETENRVIQAAKDMNYVKNVAARQLKTSKTNYIGILVPDITNEFLAKAVQVIQFDLMRHGFTPFICNTNEDETMERMHLDMLKEQNVAGIIYVSGSLLQEEQRLNIPVVFIDHKPASGALKGISLVESDNRQGSQLAVSSLYSKGCQRIACLSHEDPLSKHEVRYNAYQEALETLALPVKEAWNLKVPLATYDEARRAISESLAEGLDVDALYCTSGWLAIGAMDALIEAGVRVPEEVSVIGYDDVSITRFRNLPLTAIQEDVEKMGHSAVSILMSMLEDSQTLSQHKIIPVQLIERATTK